uniref:Interleukin-17 n=1 Tax=Panagrellus redivivus TaxID=6233 RepID=A0A7E4ZV83_PANRE
MQFWILFVVCCGLAHFSEANKRHLRRHRASPLRVLRDQCRDPPNLDSMLSSWRNEFLPTDPPMESFDEEWIAPQPEPDICSSWPEGDARSTASIMARSLCPWQWRQSHDDAREPKILSEAFCLCQRARTDSSAFCMPIRHEVPILRRKHCDPVTKTYHYIKTTQSVTIGCTSLFPRSSKASALSMHYRIALPEV